MFNIQEKSYDTVHISVFSHTGQAQMGPICTPDIGPLLSHGQPCSIVFYKMVSNQMFDVMFNFQHKSDHIVHISHFSHTGQAPTGPSFSPVSGTDKDRQMRKYYAGINSFIRRFYACSYDVICYLFRSYISNMYSGCGQFWFNSTK